MATAIGMRNARNVLLSNVTIRGFSKGIEAVNSSMVLSEANIQRCGVGLDLVNSNSVIHHSQLTDNGIDMVVNKSRAFVIDTLVYRILKILPKGDYRIDPYQIEYIALGVVNTADIREKRRRLRRLLNILKNTPLAWTVYQIIKEIIRLR
jgi:hypothetical protein